MQFDEGVVLEEAKIKSVGGEDFSPSKNYSVIAPIVLWAGTYNKIPAILQHLEAQSIAVPHPDAGMPIKLYVLEYFMRILWEVLPNFEEIDTDGNGKLSREEVETAVAKAFGSKVEGGNALMAKLLVEALDSGDGVIAREEYNTIFADGVGRQ